MSGPPYSNGANHPPHRPPYHHHHHHPQGSSSSSSSSWGFPGGPPAGPSSRQHQWQRTDPNRPAYSKGEDAQPNLDEGKNLRPPSYKIRGREPEPAPPTIGTSYHHAHGSSRGRPAYNTSYRNDSDQGGARAGARWQPGQYQGTSQQRDARWIANTRGAQTASSAVPSTERRSSAQPAYVAQPSQAPPALPSSSAARRPPPPAQQRSSDSQAAASADSSQQGKIRVSETGDVWRSPIKAVRELPQAASSSVPRSAPSASTQSQSLPPSRGQSVSRAEGSSSAPVSRAPSRSRATSSNNIPLGAKDSEELIPRVPQRDMAPQASSSSAGHPQTTSAATSDLQRPSQFTAVNARPSSSVARVSTSVPINTQSTSTTTKASLFQPRSPSPEDVKAPISSRQDPPIASSAATSSRHLHSSSSRQSTSVQVDKGKGKQKEPEVISITSSPDDDDGIVSRWQSESFEMALPTVQEDAGVPRKEKERQVSSSSNKNDKNKTNTTRSKSKKGRSRKSEDAASIYSVDLDSNTSADLSSFRSSQNGRSSLEEEAWSTRNTTLSNADLEAAIGRLSPTDLAKIEATARSPLASRPGYQRYVFHFSSALQEYASDHRLDKTELKTFEERLEIIRLSHSGYISRQTHLDDALLIEAWPRPAESCNRVELPSFGQGKKSHAYKHYVSLQGSGAKYEIYPIRIRGSALESKHESARAVVDRLLEEYIAVYAAIVGRDYVTCLCLPMRPDFAQHIQSPLELAAYNDRLDMAGLNSTGTVRPSFEKGKDAHENNGSIAPAPPWKPSKTSASQSSSAKAPPPTGSTSVSKNSSTTMSETRGLEERMSSKRSKAPIVPRRPSPSPPAPAPEPAGQSLPVTHPTSTDASRTPSISSARPLPAIIPAPSTSVLPSHVLHALTSRYPLPPSLRTANVDQRALEQFEQSCHEDIEMQHGRPVTRQEAIYTSSEVRFDYHYTPLSPHESIFLLPANCRKSYDYQAQSSSHAPDASHANREKFKLAQVSRSARDGNMTIDAYFSAAYLVLKFEESLTGGPRAAATPTITQATAPIPPPPTEKPASVRAKDEITSPPPLSRTATSGNSEAIRSRPPSFPLNIGPSYADTQHTRYHCESFLKLYFERFETNRGDLLDFYSQTCSLSYITIDEDASAANPSGLKRDAFTTYGQFAVTNALRRIPHYTHHRDDAGKFVFDAVRVGSENANPMSVHPLMISIHGELVEFETQAKRSFDRVFFLLPVGANSFAGAAGLPYMIHSDQIINRPFASMDRCKPGSLPQIPPVQARPSRAVTPQRTFVREQSIFLPPPTFQSAALRRAIESAIAVDAATGDQPESASTGGAAAPTSTSRDNRPSAQALGKRRVIELDDDDDATSSPTSCTGESRRNVKARLEAEEERLTREIAEAKRIGSSSSSNEGTMALLRRLQEDVEKLKQSNSVMDAQAARRERKIARKARKAERKQAVLDAPLQTRAEKRQAKEAEARKVSKTKPGKPTSGATSAQTGGSGSGGSGPRTSNIRDFKIRGGGIGGICRVDHPMFGSNGKARCAVESQCLRGILAFSMAGDVYLWKRSNLNAASFGSVRKVYDNTGVAPGSFLDTALWSEHHQTAVLGYTLPSNYKPGAAGVKQITLLSANTAQTHAGPWTGFTKHYPNKRPHSGSGINAMALIPDEKRLQFATAGNDRSMCFWTGPPNSADLTVTRYQTPHTSGVRGMAYSVKNKQLISVGADKKVCVHKVKAGQVVRFWKDVGPINQVYLNPENEDLAMLCLSMTDDQFHYVDLRKPGDRPVLTFGVTLDHGLSRYRHGAFHQNVFAFALDEQLLLWDLRNVSQRNNLALGNTSGVIQPIFSRNPELSTLSLLEKKNFASLDFIYPQ